MPFDAEVELPPITTNQNMARLIARLKELEPNEYRWQDPNQCVIGHARRLMRARGPSNGDIYAWLGISDRLGNEIFLSSRGGLDTPKVAARALEQLVRSGHVAGHVRHDPFWKSWFRL